MNFSTHLARTNLSRLTIGVTDARGNHTRRAFTNDGSGHLIEQPVPILQPVEPDGTDSVPNEPPPLPTPALRLDTVRVSDFANLLCAARSAAHSLERFLQLHDPSNADLKALERLHTALTPFDPDRQPKHLKPIHEVTPMSLSADAVKLARRYMKIVNRYENEFDSSGYTPHEMELVRTRAHNALIEQLRAEGVDVSDRAATTDLARLVDQWLRE